MKVTKEFLSLETNKLLKNCGIESEYSYLRYKGEDEDFIIVESWRCNDEEYEFFPAFTWSEILWEYAEEFFDYDSEVIHYSKGMFSEIIGRAENLSSIPENQKHIFEILYLLQLKRYNEADLYFRENCILIKK